MGRLGVGPEFGKGGGGHSVEGLACLPKTSFGGGIIRCFLGGRNCSSVGG